MGPRSRDIVARGLGAIEAELRAQRADRARDRALLEAIAIKMGVTGADVERHERTIHEHGRSLSELELRVYAGGRNGGE